MFNCFCFFFYTGVVLFLGRNNFFYQIMTRTKTYLRSYPFQASTFCVVVFIVIADVLHFIYILMWFYFPFLCFILQIIFINFYQVFRFYSVQARTLLIDVFLHNIISIYRAVDIFYYFINVYSRLAISCHYCYQFSILFNIRL